MQKINAAIEIINQSRMLDVLQDDFMSKCTLLQIDPCNLKVL